jgi:hypothetical protein
VVAGGAELAVLADGSPMMCPYYFSRAVETCGAERNDDDMPSTVPN